MTRSDGEILIFGGTGFLGRQLVRELVEAGQGVRLAARHPRRPDWAEPQDPITLCPADIRDEAAVAEALAGVSAVINAVSGYVERRGASFETIHVEGAARLARLAREAGITRLVQLSGIGAHRDSPSAYVRARARGEAAVLEHLPKAIILRPSVMFGADDAFLNGLARLTRLPAIPLFGAGETRLQPVHVADVARAVAILVDTAAPPRRLFELGGPDVLSYRQILGRIQAQCHTQRPLLPLPFWAWRTLAGLLSPLPNPPLTRDQVLLMAEDNLVGEGVGSFADLGIVPRTLRDSLPLCLP